MPNFQNHYGKKGCCLNSEKRAESIKPGENL